MEYTKYTVLQALQESVHGLRLMHGKKAFEHHDKFVDVANAS